MLVEFVKENFFKFIFFLSALFVALGEIFGFTHKIYDKSRLGKVDKRAEENSQRIDALNEELNELEENLKDIKKVLKDINSNVSENAKQNTLNIKATFLMLQVIESSEIENKSTVTNEEIREVKKEMFNYFTDAVNKSGGGINN